MKQIQKSLDAASGNVTNWENRHNCQLQAVLLLLQLPICAISPTQWAKTLLSLASGKYPSVKKEQLLCPSEKTLDSSKRCNPIKCHQSHLMLIFKINNHLIPTINICYVGAFWLYWEFTESDVSPHVFFCNYLNGKMCIWISICFLEACFCWGYFKSTYRTIKCF